MRLKDKTAIITGGAKGIGKAFTVKFAEEGAHVVIADVDQKSMDETVKELTDRGLSAFGVVTDITKKESVTNLCDKAIEKFGKIDILVNNAGIMRSTEFENITEAEWDLVMAINLKGVFLCCQGVVENMKKNGFGRILNMASNAGRDGGVSTCLAYSASKAAVIGLTRGLAKRMAKYGITCNSIAPGTTNSDMIKNFTPEMLDNLKATIPVGRLGEPRDYAELACYICSDAGSFMTGAVVDVNGGLFIG